MSDLNAGQVTAFFDRVASDWDEMRLVYYDETVIEQLAAAVDVDASMTVADVGTGTGFVAAGLAGRVARVIGIDDSAGMLADERFIKGWVDLALAVAAQHGLT